MREELLLALGLIATGLLVLLRLLVSPLSLLVIFLVTATLISLILALAAASFLLVLWLWFRLILGPSSGVGTLGGLLIGSSLGLVVVTTALLLIFKVLTSGHLFLFNIIG
jgi:hypothetical protein